MANQSDNSFTLWHWERAVLLCAMASLGVSVLGYLRLCDTMPPFEKQERSMPPMPSVVSAVVTDLNLANRPVYNPFHSTFDIVKPQPKPVVVTPPLRPAPPKPRPAPPKPKPHTMTVAYTGMRTALADAGLLYARLTLVDSKEGETRLWLPKGTAYKDRFTVVDVTEKRLLLRDAKGAEHVIQADSETTMNLD